MMEKGIPRLSKQPAKSNQKVGDGQKVLARTISKAKIGSIWMY